MSIEIQTVQRVRAVLEPGTVGADCSSTILASGIDLPIREGTGTFTTDEAMHDPMQVVQSRLEGRKKVRGKRSGTVKFTMNLAPTGVPAVAATTAVQGALGYLLKAVLGGESLAAGDTAAAASTASVVNAATSGARWAAGKWMGWVNPAGELEWRPVESVAANAVTLKMGFSGAPAAGNVLYNAAVYYMTEDPSTTLAFLVEGAESDDRWLLTGAQCTGLTISVDPSGTQLPAIEFSFGCTNWFDSSETLSAITGTLGFATYSNYNPVVGFAGSLRVQTVGVAVADATSEVCASAIEFAPQITYTQVTCPDGVQSVKRWVRTKPSGNPVTGSFTTYFEDLTWWTAKKNRTDLAVWYDAGQVAGGSVILDAPCVQITNPQRTPTGEQLAGQTVQWEGRRDIDVGVSTNELAKSPLRIVLG